MATTQSRSRIDQWVPALHRGDAIGDSAGSCATRSGRGATRRTCGRRTSTRTSRGRPALRRFASSGAGPGDVVILHYALPSRMSEDLRAFPGRRVLLHHNITPPEFFAPWDPEMVRICASAASRSAGLRGDVDLALADSEFSRRELEEAGFARTGVLPIFLDFARYREPPSPVLLRQLDDGRTNLLFVGRLAPNKRQEDLVRLVSFWKRFVSPAVRLVLVGRLPRRATGRGPSAPGALLRRAPGVRLRGGPDPGGGALHRARGPPRPPRLLRGRRRLRVDERARGLRRAARGGDAHGRPRAGAAGGRGGVHDRGGRRRRSRGRDLAEVAEMARLLATEASCARRSSPRRSDGSRRSPPPRSRRTLRRFVGSL